MIDIIYILHKVLTAIFPISFPFLCLLSCSSNNYPEIKRLFPDAEIQHIPDAGHWVHADQPQEFITAICNFIALHPL